LLAQQEREHKQRQDFACSLDDLCLGVIDVLDLLEEREKDKNAGSYLPKIAKRQRTVLKKQHIQEFAQLGDEVLPGLIGY
jgi:hypothetical protein